MLFNKILVAIDGSKYSQYAAEFGFQFAREFGASLAAEHVVDPRLVDLFVEPEFASELGFGRSVDTMEKVISGLRKLGNVVLRLFGDCASFHALKTDAFLDEGYILDEILKRSKNYDLIIVGHRGRGERPLATDVAIGSVAERLAGAASKPVLIAQNDPKDMDQVMVAFDGSEPAIGALRMAEMLARALNKPLKAVYVASQEKGVAEGNFAIEQGQKYLNETWPAPVFSVSVGKPADTILKLARDSKSLLVLGAYGFKDPDQVVMGSTATQIVRKAQTSVVIYR